MDASAQIEAKLNKSLEELIREQEQSNRGHGRGSGRFSDRGRGGRGGRASARGHRRQRDDNEMETDDNDRKRGRRLDTSVLKPKGGVAKAQGGGNRDSRERVTKGNPNRQWAHDLHQDSGPSRPRQVKEAQGHRPVLNMTVVRISNLPAQVTYEDLHELVSLVDEPQSLKMEYAADGTRTCEAYMRSEDSARAVQQRYSECALDGQPLRVQLGGTHAKTMLSSGLALEKVHSAPGGGPAPLRTGGGAGHRGRAAPRGRMRGYN